MTAEQLLREGKPAEAIAALTPLIKARPADPKLRVFLFQLLAIEGQWERAVTQLSVIGGMDALALPMAQAYREALRCELLRAEVFAGRRSPLIFGDPEPWIAVLLDAIRAAAEGHFAQASEARDRALAEAPAISGTVSFPKTNEADEPRTEAFAWLADGDSRLGPVLEAVVNGRYYWIPQSRVRRIDIERPADLRDFVWAPAHFTWANGGDAVGLIPTRYAGSEKQADPLLRLSRKTDWTQAAPGYFLGLGQRMFQSDVGDYSLLDLARIDFDPPSPESGADG